MNNITHEQIEAAILRQEISSRGGGIEISLNSFGFPGERMTAYQNYLGGGLLGRVCSDCTLLHKNVVVFEADKLERVTDALKEYFHFLTNPDSEWESQSYEQNQRMPESAF